MREVWLLNNRRALWMGMSMPGIIAAGSLVGVFSGFMVARIASWLLLCLAVVLLALIVWWMRQPRLAFDGGILLVYLRAGGPYRVPIDAVECFFLGSGPLKLSDQIDAPYRTVNLIVRLAEKATDWADRPVKPALGRWHEGYIMIYGAWCEPLSLEVVSRLNVRLHQIQHPSDDQCQSTSAATSVAAESIGEPAPSAAEQNP